MRSPTNRTRQWCSGPVFRHRSSSGLTIIELLIASAIALLMVAGMVTAFQVISDQVRNARAVLEVSGQLRMGQHVIREDLANISAPVRPWLRPSDGHGYFEYLEGKQYDGTAFDTNTDYATMGDTDDIIMFTARNELEPFRGRFGGNLIISREAEIIVWTRWTDRNDNGIRDPEDPITIHRKVLLIRPDLTPTSDASQSRFQRLKTFYASNDISVRIENNVLSANSLADLTKRENRFAHFAWDRGANQPLTPVFPFPLDPRTLEELAQSRQGEPNLGKDVVLSNVLAFDVQAYDPLVEIRDDNPDPAQVGSNALLPHDVGYDNAAPDENVIGLGGYVDLDYRRYLSGSYQSHLDSPGNASHFSHPPRVRSGLSTVPPLPPSPRWPSSMVPVRTYCTWSFHYENDGVNQDLMLPAQFQDGLIDEGTNGVDNDPPGANNAVDDVGERETSPPYPFPLRGIKITIRLYEPDSQAVRQGSIIQDFIPE